MPVEQRESPPENKLHEIAGYSGRTATVENGQNKHCNNVLAFLQSDTMLYHGWKYRLTKKKTFMSFTDFTMSSPSINANAASKYFVMIITDLIFFGIYYNYSTNGKFFKHYREHIIIQYLYNFFFFMNLNINQSINTFFAGNVFRQILL